jgi:multiple sugar transport system ATP-binding protein
LGVRPEDVLITDAASSNTVKTRVERSEALGSEILVHLSHADALDESLSTAERLRQDIARRAALVAKMGPRVKVTAGDVLSVQISPEHAHFFDVESGRSLRRS